MITAGPVIDSGVSISTRVGVAEWDFGHNLSREEDSRLFLKYNRDGVRPGGIHRVDLPSHFYRWYCFRCDAIITTKNNLPPKPVWVEKVMENGCAICARWSPARSMGYGYRHKLALERSQEQYLNRKRTT